MNNYEVNLNGEKYPLEIIFKPNKNIYLRVKDGKIVCTCHKRTDINYIFELIYKNEKFLLKRLDEKQEEVIHYLGKAYEVIILEDKKNEISFVGDICFINTKNKDNEYVKKILYKFYLDELTKYIDSIKDEAFDIFNIHDVNIKYRYMTSRFGVYNKIKKEVTLSTRLMKYDYIYIKSVLYHELSHYYVMNHSAKFYEIYEKSFYNAKKIQHQLKTFRYKDLM